MINTSKQQTTNENGSFLRRLAARIIDRLLITVPIVLIAAVLFPDAFHTYFNVESTYSHLDTIIALVSLIYVVVFPLFKDGQTVGKYLMSIRIISEAENTELNPLQMILREFVAQLLYGITFGILLVISGLMVIFRKDKRSIHDLMASTSVKKTTKL